MNEALHRFHCAIGAITVCTVLLVSCGESDLKTLQAEEITAARQAGELNGDNVNVQPTPDEGQVPDAPDTSSDNETTAVETLLANYALVFSDEFDGGSLDSTRWNTALQWGPDIVVNDEEQYYVDSLVNPDFGYDPIAFNGESLVITADRTPSDLLEAANNQSYLSGVLTSRSLFDFQYGYAEIRAKLPAGKGFWPGFWMLGSEFIDRKPQLFVMENRGDNPAIAYHRYNYSNDNDEFVYSDLLQSVAADYSAEFHTFGVEWSAGKLVFYVDGDIKHTITDENVAAQDMYLIISLAVGGWFPESPDTDTVFPGQFEIDYVRVYQRP